MLTIVEGIDGTGKTTLARSIAKGSHVPILRLSKSLPYADLAKCGVPVNTWVEDSTLMELWNTVQFSAVLDRSIMSGIAYHEPPMKVWTHSLDILARHKDHVRVVLLDARDDTVAERDPDWQDRGEELHRLRSSFGVMMGQLKKLRVPVMKIDTDDLTPEQVLQRFCQNIGWIGWDRSLVTLHRRGDTWTL